MCGICGIISPKKNGIVKESLIRQMCSAMRHRGPDDEGVYLYPENDPFVGLGHRRLNIIDLSKSGHQPMTNEDKTLWLSFNGEIYNFHELKAELIKKNHKFISNTDTEVVIHLYEEYGKDCVKLLRGMFAFALWDKKKDSLFLARDRVGKKPLLYSYVNGIFIFASEFLPLIESGLTGKEIDFKALQYYLRLGNIPAPLTIYRSMRKLEPGSFLIFKQGEIRIEKYWQPDYSKKINISEEEAAGEILRLLKEAVKIRLYSDVPLGAFLSGGIDSSTIVGIMSQLSSSRIKTFSIGFEESAYNELEYARVIAKRFNTQHHEFIVKPEALKVLPVLVERYGEPYADSSCIPTYYVAQQTKQYVTVALNGDGGDELFGGYERYQAMLIAQKVPEFSKNIIKSLSSILPDSLEHKNKIRRIKRFLGALTLPLGQRYLKWQGIFDEQLLQKILSDDLLKDGICTGESGLSGNLFNTPNNLSLLDSLLYFDTLTYLPNDLLVKVDIASMANSLEARSPFIDHQLIEFVAKLPGRFKIRGFVKKYILKKIIKDFIPAGNIKRSKMGFGVPVGKWLKGDLKGFLFDNLLSKKSLERGYFKPAAVKELVYRHVENKEDFSFQIWSLLMFELWHQRFID
ncbi:MAG: asparagine synthase (glutamine-hydrolyzing) [Candidatus Omnitrophica bacterium]|nr:asparagine synthase (glutamine-hydrolyzing) [Candidatus Omnitrophota bacterium]MDD5652714.1 asparagine synthase (glutamine-hydrolyzing) [Candidatus Omnitrophota bacterium]